MANPYAEIDPVQEQNPYSKIDPIAVDNPYAEIDPVDQVLEEGQPEGSAGFFGGAIRNRSRGCSWRCVPCS